LGVDPRTDHDESGLFVVPNSKFIGDTCFDSYSIGHNREAEGYEDTWYDAENMDESYKQYTFQVDYSSTTSDIYFTVETYSHAIIPLECTTGKYSAGGTVNYPVAFVEVYKNSVL